MTRDAALLATAEQARLLVINRPKEARDLAEYVLAVTQTPEAVAVALRALGLATRELGAPRSAVRHLRHAVAVAEQAGLTQRANESRLSLVVVLADLGDTIKALQEADQTADGLRGVDAVRLLSQRGVVLQRLGRVDEALACYRRALPLLRRDPDPAWAARVLLHRGILHAYRGAHGAALRDLRRCVTRCEEHGLDLMRSMALHNLGFAALRRGDVPQALRRFDESGEIKRSLEARLASFHTDRAAALMAVGLANEARRDLEAAVAELERDGFAYDLAEARLLLAQAELADGDHVGAATSAEAAVRALRRQGRTTWAALAEHVAIRARWAGGDRSAALARAARRSATRLVAAGWPVAAPEGRVLAARVLLDRGQIRAAAAELQQVAGARRHGPASARAAAWHAEALHRLAKGNRTGARAALRAGLRVVEEHATSLGASDLRTHAAIHGEELAALGGTMALEDGDARGFLAWSERYRAGALRRPPARPPRDRDLAANLAALRRVTADIAAAVAAGRSTGVLRAEQVALERAVRDRSRHADGGTALGPGWDLGAVRAALGGRVLVEMMLHDDVVHAVTVTPSRVRLHRLGAYAEVLHEQESLRFSLHRLARRHGSPASQEAARRSLRHAAERLDALLLTPLRDALADRDVVLIPTMALHALPWPVLPSLAGRPVTVAPSATSWFRAMKRSGTRGDRRTVLAAGPGLDHADAEVDSLAELYPEAQRLTGAAATADAVRRALDGAGLVHIAAHGRFRADNPQFSSLDLADGPLMVYDLERVRRAPRTLILSACDSALSAVRPGDELMGLAAAVFSLGTRTLVATVTPVGDEDAHTVMTAFHKRLATGASPSRALADAGTEAGVSGFVCFGVG